MVIYVKFGEVEDLVQFTTALEAKEHIEKHELGDGEELKVFVAVHSEPTDEPAFSSFDNLEGVKEFVDAEVGSGSEEGEDKEDSAA